MPTRRGFGTALIERSLKAEGGSAVPDYAVEGLRWVLTLPHRARTTRNAVDGPTRYPAESEPSASIEALRGRRFLIIEDEPLVTMEIASLLEDAGATIVATAATESEALALIDETGCDAALLDGNLQGKLVGEMARVLVDKAIPFLFVTGYGRDHLPAGFESWPLVLKPFNAAMLVAQTAQLLTTQQANGRSNRGQLMPVRRSAPHRSGQVVNALSALDSDRYRQKD